MSATTYIDAGDGSRWFFSSDLNLWTGWMPGEDGVWTRDPDEMARYYPDVVAAHNGSEAPS